MSIKSISSALSIFVCAGFMSLHVYAATIEDATTVLFSPDIIIDFSENPDVSLGDTITNQFESFGVTFSPTFVYGYETEPYLSIAQGHLKNIAGVQPGSILFSSDVTAAVFSWRAAPPSTDIRAYNDGVLVELFDPHAQTNTSIPVDSGRYYGFENILFDEIRLSIDSSSRTFFTLDNLQYVSAIPVPAAVWLFGSGLLGLIGVARRNN